MKRRDLIQMVEKHGWWLARRGGGHDIFTNGKQSVPIARHTEINEMTAKGILKKVRLK